MDWIQQNYVNVFAVIGALYAAALLFVKLTPTPRDDAALEKVGVVLKFVAAVFGLNLKQGLESKPPETNSKKSGRARVEELIFLVFVAATLAAGCASSGDQYQASSFAFVAAADTATELRRAGKLTEQDVKTIGEALDDGHAALSAWANALKADQDYPNGSEIVSLIVERIRARIRAREE